MFQKSLSLRITAKIMFLLIGGMAVLLLFQSYLTESFYSNEFAKNYQEKTLLLASQMDGGIKWKKVAKIEQIYEKQIDPEEESNLANVLVTDAEKNSLSSYSAEIYQNVELAAFLQDYKPGQEGSPYQTVVDTAHIITIAEVADKKSGNIIGYVAMAWSKQSALNSLATVRNTTLGASGFITLIIAVLLVFLLKSMAIKPITRIKEVMSRLAHGEHDTDVPYTEAADEIGQMAQALLVFKDNATEIIRMKEREDERTALQDEQLKSELLRIADVLDREVQSAVSDTNGQADSMKSSSSEMNTVIGELSAKTSTVGEGAERATGAIQAVASATEELSTSISEITRQVGQASSIAQEASKEAQRTDKTVGGLSEAAQKIGDVIDMIQDIAKQTNLLAPNATIEAARAGEMGKGFAVVASEVKNLASQTAKATEEISSQIGAIREETDGAVSAIRSISGTIEQINEISDGIANAVEQQSHATQEISSSVQNTVQHMSEVSQQVSDVANGTKQVNQHSQTVMENAEQTSVNIGRLDTRMSEVLRELRDSASVDRRGDPRVKGSWKVQVIADEVKSDCLIGNVSLGGAQLDGFDSVSEGQSLVLCVEGLDEQLSARAVAVSAKGTHVKFDLAAGQLEKITSFFGLKDVRAA